MEAIGVISAVLTLVGVIVAIVQMRKARESAEAARIAAEDARSSIALNTIMQDVGTCAGGFEEVQSLIRIESYHSALLRVSDLIARVAQIKGAQSGTGTIRIPGLKNTLTQLEVLRELLEEKVADSSKEVDPLRVNRILSQISAALHEWLGKSKFKGSEGGTK